MRGYLLAYAIAVAFIIIGKRLPGHPGAMRDMGAGILSLLLTSVPRTQPNLAGGGHWVNNSGEGEALAGALWEVMWSRPRLLTLRIGGSHTMPAGGQSHFVRRDPTCFPWFYVPVSWQLGPLPLPGPN